MLKKHGQGAHHSKLIPYFCSPNFGRMNKNSEFRIPVSGLALGSHSYCFEIDDDFFVGKDYSEIQQGKVTVNLNVDRAETMMTLHFSLDGEVRVPCDRCAEEFNLPITDKQEFILKLGTENTEEADDVAVVEADTHDFDVSSLIYEYIILAVPIYRVHPEGQCNPEVIARLTAIPEVTEDDAIDPRWAALKDLKFEDVNN
jgi:uncharacterized metal-binding protein YceD (DUF177 family)